jgi:AraC family transcriptional activator of pobA
MRPAADIPVYKLYGEQEHWLTPDLIHCESIAARSRLHNWHIKPHQHHGLFQILYLKDGTAKIQLDDCQLEMRGPQVLAVPQMCVHGFRFAHNAGGQVFTLAYPLLDRIGQQLGEGLGGLNRPQIHTLGEDEESAHLRLAFSMLDSEYKRDARFRNMQIESLLGTILVWIARRAQAQRDDASGAGAPRIAGGAARHFGRAPMRAFFAMVEESYAKHHSVAHYARRIGITAAHLNVLCRQAVNQSALELIHERMLLEAKRNLVYTSMTVSAVSYMLGFSDPAYFTRFFKRQTGMSPKEFRLQAKAMFDQARASGGG